MSSRDSHILDKKTETTIIAFVVLFSILVVISMIAFRFFGTMLLLMFMTITIGTSLFFGSLPKNKDNKIPLMVLGAMLGIIIGGSIVLYSVHERKEMCTPPYESDSDKILCLL
ncbi:TPA: hypothetical protein ACUM9F_005161 [Klebsiella pneumoniae]